MTLGEFLAEAEWRAERAVGPTGLTQADIEQLQQMQEEDQRNGIGTDQHCSDSDG